MVSQLPFSNGSTIMVCKHIYRWSSCKVSLVIPFIRRHKVFNPQRQFYRFPGREEFLASGQVTCLRCAMSSSPSKIDYIETVWRNGRADVADVMRGRQ